MRWFEHETDEAKGYWLKPPYDKVYVAPDPHDGLTKASADSFDAFVNVSDSECAYFEPSRPGQHMHWYPVNESGRWNLSYLFWLKKVLDYHHEKGHRVYLHCHAGAYRSPSAAVLWLISRGHSRDEALTLGKESGSHLYKLWRSYDNVPKGADQLFQLMREHPDHSLAGILMRLPDVWNHEIHSGYLRTIMIKRRYFWFYYDLQDRYRALRDWLKREGYTQDGFCRIVYRRRHFWAKAAESEPALDYPGNPWVEWSADQKRWIKKEKV